MGKNLAERCPYPTELKQPATNEYFMQAVDEFLLTFPTLNNFVRNTDVRIQNGTNNISCLAFVRMNSRNGFMNFVKQMKHQKNEFS